MSNVHKALLEIVKSTTYPNDVRVGAAAGLSVSCSPEIQDALVAVAKSTTYPNDVRAAAATAAGTAHKPA